MAETFSVALIASSGREPRYPGYRRTRGVEGEPVDFAEVPSGVHRGANCFEIVGVLIDGCYSELNVSRFIGPGITPRVTVHG